MDAILPTFGQHFLAIKYFLVRASLVKKKKKKKMPAMPETQVQSLGREYPLKKGMTTHSSILAWRTPWTEEPGRLQSML